MPPHELQALDKIINIINDRELAISIVNIARKPHGQPKRPADYGLVRFEELKLFYILDLASIAALLQEDQELTNIARKENVIPIGVMVSGDIIVLQKNLDIGIAIKNFDSDDVHYDIIKQQVSYGNFLIRSFAVGDSEWVYKISDPR